MLSNEFLETFLNFDNPIAKNFFLKSNLKLSSKLPIQMNSGKYFFWAAFNHQAYRQLLKSNNI